MTRYALALLALTACADPSVGYAPLSLTIADDGGTASGVMTWESGETIWAHQANDPVPTGGVPDLVPLMSWESPQEGVLHIGHGQCGVACDPVRVTQIDADEKVSFLLNGGQVIKLQDHPLIGNLWWFGEVEHVWWGNTLNGDADLRFQGTSSVRFLDPETGVAEGYDMRITGQSMDGRGDTTTAVGGDVHIRGGSATSALPITLYPGDLVLGGGRAGNPATGNVALHEHPLETGTGDDWGGMQGGVYVRDAIATPTSDPADGGFLFASGGALYWRGSAGTVTMLAAP